MFLSGLNSTEYFFSCYLGNTELLETAASAYIAQDMERLLDHLFKGQELRAAFSSQTSCMRGGKLGLFRPGKMPSFQAAMCSQNTKKVFLSAVPHDGHSPRPWTSLLLENTTRGAIDNEKQPQTKGGGLLSSADLISMSCSGKFGLFLFGWTLTTVPSFLQCCNWARTSLQCIFCNQFAVAQVLHFQT